MKVANPKSKRRGLWARGRHGCNLPGACTPRGHPVRRVRRLAAPARRAPQRSTLVSAAPTGAPNVSVFPPTPQPPRSPRRHQTFPTSSSRVDVLWLECQWCWQRSHAETQRQDFDAVTLLTSQNDSNLNADVALGPACACSSILSNPFYSTAHTDTTPTARHSGVTGTLCRELGRQVRR